MQKPRYLCLQSLHDLSHIIASPLSNTPAKIFSLLLFQLSKLFFIQAENTRNNQSSFPIAITTLSYLFIDFRNFCISNSSFKSSTPLQEFFQLPPSFFTQMLVSQTLQFLSASDVSLHILSLKKKVFKPFTF